MTGLSLVRFARLINPRYSECIFARVATLGFNLNWTADLPIGWNLTHENRVENLDANPASVDDKLSILSPEFAGAR